MTIPHLTTALSGALSDLERRIVEATSAIEDWLRGRCQEHATPFYSSVDLRNSGYKIVPVDINLYPGGFNNLNRDFDALCVQAVLTAIRRNCTDASRILLIPENHTRNTGYMQNVGALHRILRDAGMDVRIGSLLPDLTAPMDIEVPGGGKLTLEPLTRSGNRIGVNGFDPCMVLLNNDLSAGLPEILRNLEQPVLPPLNAGWFMRRKSNHFTVYQEVATEFAQLIGIDPWLINPYFGKCGKVNFAEHAGEECLAGYVEEVLDEIRYKYKQYGITQEPFVIAKADSGTYGMAIMTVKDPSEIRNLNRRDRKKMEMAKGHVEVHEVLVQEGVHCIDRVNGAVAEPVVYMIDQSVVGAFYRAHAGRGEDQNLNTPGSRFEQLAFEKSPASSNPGEPDSPPNRFYAYSVIARLAMVAAAIEITRTKEAFGDGSGFPAPVAPH